MKKLWVIILIAVLSGCSSEEKVFKECNFELTKVIAIKGESLDKNNNDWNQIMKRQFFNDCFEAKGYKLTEEFRQMIR